MKSVIVTILGILINVSAFANERGVNEQVSMKYYNGAWGYTYESTGFEVGNVTVKFVPVTREASATIRALNKNSVYACTLEDATLLKDVFFVRDMSCK